MGQSQQLWILKWLEAKSLFLPAYTRTTPLFVFPNDCYSYVLFANITIHQTCTIQRQSHLWPSMTHEWIVQSVCSFRRHCKWQTDCKERAEKLLRIFLENCSSIKRGGGYFLSFLENVTWPHHYEVPLKSVGRSIHYFNTHYTSSP